MSRPDAGSKSPIGALPLKPLRSLPSRPDCSNGTAEKQAGRAQRVCKILLERHGERIIQLLVESNDGRELLKQLLAVSFAASDRGGGTLLKRLLERDPESVVPFLLRKSDDQLVTRGLGACLARGISGVQADELRPVTSALAEEILKQLQTPVSQESTSTDTARKTEHEPTSAAEADASTEETTNSKRPDNESVTEEPLRRPSRVQELIELQQRRVKQQQEQRPKCRMGASGSLEGISRDVGSMGFKSRGGSFEALLKEALIFAASEASSAEVEELCDRLVNFAPPVLTRVIQIEVARSFSEKPIPSPSASTSAEALQGEQQQSLSSP